MNKKILVANRGEIARRIIKTIHKMGFESVAIYAEADKTMPFVMEAVESYSLGSGSLQETYLDIEKIISLAVTCNAKAIHPGYGFLSENPAFAEACIAEGIVFIGPSPASIALMGDKIKAREYVGQLDLPVVEGKTGTTKEILALQDKVVYPLIVKAAHGGGGKGMIKVYKPAELQEALESAARQANNYFGSDTVFVEQYIPEARHIEVQIIGDQHNHYLHLFERECSVQRKYQKIIEEAPSPYVTDKIRDEITGAALKIARSMQYSSVGTVEFLVDKQGRHYFLEMNTRIQVEHPVTEMITGIDIVREQIMAAFGHALEYNQEGIKLNGHAIEARIYAENPEQGFLPSAGEITHYTEPKLAGIRTDSAITSGNTISGMYDAMVAKIIAHATNREEALKKLNQGLNHFFIDGINHNISFLSYFINTDDFIGAQVSTAYIDNNLKKIGENLTINRDENRFMAAFLGILAYHLPFTEKETVKGPMHAWKNVWYTNIQLGEEQKQLFVKTDTDGTLIGRIDGEEFRFKLDFHQKNRLSGQINKQNVISFYSIHDKDIHLFFNGIQYNIVVGVKHLPNKLFTNKGVADKSNLVISPLYGKVIKINVTEKSSIQRGDELLVIESMKMENKVVAQHDAVVKDIKVQTGQQVDNNTVLMEMEI